MREGGGCGLPICPRAAFRTAKRRRSSHLRNLSPPFVLAAASCAVGKRRYAKEGRSILSPPPRRALCRRRHCSATREGCTREETEPRGSSAMERREAHRICHRRSAQPARCQTTLPSVKLSPSLLPEVAIGAATPLLSFFILQ
ncbi:hypothetical protein AHAS_Ahas01G0170800 [Arachis hypogaea]